MEIFGMVLRNLFLSSLCLGGGCTPCQNAIRDEDKGIFSLGSLREKIDTVSAVSLAVRGVRGARQIVCVAGVWHFSLRLWPKPAEAAHSAPPTTRMPRPLGASPCTAEYVHTWLKAPYPVRFVKLSNHRLS